MPNGRKQAEMAAAAVLRVLDANPGASGIQSVAGIIEIALHDAAREQEKKELKRIAEVQASAHAISKQGDRYLRSLFTAGALAVIRYAKLHGTKHRPWLTALLARGRPRSPPSRSPTRSPEWLGP